jgi:hypothetical protein
VVKKRQAIQVAVTKHLTFGKKSIFLCDWLSSGVKKDVKKYSVKTFVSFTAGDVGTSCQPRVANIFANFLSWGADS